MSRKMNRFDLIDAAQRLRKCKEELAKVAIVLDMDKSFFEVVRELKIQITSVAIELTNIDQKIIDMDFPTDKDK